ncbi:hypothetical protein Sste5346_005606 [Sporothrix stenoceras]|uniref:PH domain protein n=1 Tax=Sporothrix stenoceras TaxID=5173 RepID=A0ABR3Z5X4_9PEZI
MSGALFEMVAKRALRDTAKKNINSKDPYYEEVAIYGRNGRPTGKVKKQKKGIPAILSHNDGKVLKKVRKQAFRLDMSLFNCCGIRFGWSSVIGIFPVIGDAIDLLLAYLVVKNCAKIDGGLPPSLQYRMYFNILLDFGIGLVPFVGDVADAIFRANTRNAWILEEYLIKKAEAEREIQAEKDRRDRPPRDSGIAAGGTSGAAGASASAAGRAHGERPAPKKSWWSSWSRSGEQGGVHPEQEMAMTDVEHGGGGSSSRAPGMYSGGQQSGVTHGGRA